MLKLAKIASDPRIYVGDGVVRRHVPDPTTLADLQYRMQTGELPGDPVVHVVSRIEWLGEDVTR